MWTYIPQSEDFQQLPVILGGPLLCPSFKTFLTLIEYHKVSTVLSSYLAH